MLARSATARGGDGEIVAKQLGEKLVAADLKLIVVFADWRLDPSVIATSLQRMTAAPVVGCTAVGVLCPDPRGTSAVGFYGDVRVGIGVAADLSKHALARSRDAVERAAAALDTRAELLDPARHVAFTLVDAMGSEEPFCVGSATAAPQIRMVGGGASTGIESGARLGATAVFARGEVLTDAAIVVIFETSQKFEIITSSHLVATDQKTVVTGCAGRTILELDGMPARRRFAELIAKLGGTFDSDTPLRYTFARMIDGVPYVRSIGVLEERAIQLASAVEPGHVLRIMRTGDVVAQTRRDLAATAERIGGVSSLIAFSCVYRDLEAVLNGTDTALAEVFEAYPTTGFQSFGEQAGLLFVNHTLTALAFGGRDA